MHFTPQQQQQQHIVAQQQYQQYQNQQQFVSNWGAILTVFCFVGHKCLDMALVDTENLGIVRFHPLFIA